MRGIRIGWIFIRRWSCDGRGSWVPAFAGMTGSERACPDPAPPYKQTTNACSARWANPPPKSRQRSRPCGLRRGWGERSQTCPPTESSAPLRLSGEKYPSIRAGQRIQWESQRDPTNTPTSTAFFTAEAQRRGEASPIVGSMRRARAIPDGTNFRVDNRAGADWRDRNKGLTRIRKAMPQNAQMEQAAVRLGAT